MPFDDRKDFSQNKNERQQTGLDEEAIPTEGLEVGNLLMIMRKKKKKHQTLRKGPGLKEYHLEKRYKLTNQRNPN